MVGCGWTGFVRDASTPLSPLLSVHLVQEGGGISGDGHRGALDHGAWWRAGRHAGRLLLPSLGFFLLQPLFGHLSPIHSCVGTRLGLWRPDSGWRRWRSGGRMWMMSMWGLWGAAGILRRCHGLLLARCGIRIAGCHQGCGHGLLRCCKHVISAAAAASSRAAASAVTVLTGGPLGRCCVGVLSLSGHSCYSVKHLGRHISR